MLLLPHDQPVLPRESRYISITNALSDVISQTMFYSRQSIKNEPLCWFYLTWRTISLRSNANCCEIWETCIYIHVKHIPVEFGLFLSATETLSFRVIGVLKTKGSQKLRKKLDSIKTTYLYTQRTPTNKTHLHNQQFISPASEIARFGGLAVPLCAAHRGGSCQFG